jgi:hypothetical protein
MIGNVENYKYLLKIISKQSLKIGFFVSLFTMNTDKNHTLFKGRLVQEKNTKNINARTEKFSKGVVV